MKFYIMLSAVILACVTFVSSSRSYIDGGINLCEDTTALTLVFKGFRDYGKITSRNEMASFIVGMSELKKSRRIISRIRHNGEKQAIILRIDSATYSKLEHLGDSDDIENVVKRIAYEYKQNTKWRLFYVMLPYGAPEKIVAAFNSNKICVISTAVKVPEDMNNADVSEFKGVAVFDTDSYDFKQDYLEKFSSNTIPLRKCIPRESIGQVLRESPWVYDEISTIRSVNRSINCQSHGAFTIFIKGALKYYDIINTHDSESVFIVTLDDIVKYGALIKTAIADGRTFAASLSEQTLNNCGTAIQSLRQITNFSKKIKYLMLPDRQGCDVRHHHSMTEILTTPLTRFTLSDAEIEKIGTRINFSDLVQIDLDTFGPPIGWADTLAKGLSETEKEEKKILATRMELFRLMNDFETKLEKSLCRQVSLYQCINDSSLNIHIEFKRRNFYSNFSVCDNLNAGTISMNLNRSILFRDTVQSFRNINNDQLTQKNFMIQFLNEPALDYGGVKRTWYSLIIDELFNPEKTALFYLASDKSSYHPEPDSDLKKNDRECNNVEDEGITRVPKIDHLKYFTFAGRFIAKAVIDKIPTGIVLSRALCKMILGRKPTFYDLQNFDASIHKSLMFFVDNEVEDYEFKFTVDTDLRHTIPLVAGGENVDVTDNNKFKYIYLRFLSKVYTTSKPQIDAFIAGFYEIIPKKYISSFTVSEFQKLISGEIEINVDEWKRSSIYDHPYYLTHPNILNFWQVVREFNNDERRKLLLFVTGSSCVPLGGFSQLRGNTNNSICPFKISSGNYVMDSNHLPKAHSCFNTIDLPDYPDKATLKEKLLYAINNSSTEFGLA